MGLELDEKLDKVLEEIAINGLVSAYSLKDMLKVPLSAAQRWLSILRRSREVMIYETKTRPIKRKLHGLTIVGLLHALSRPRVRQKFPEVFQKVMEYSKDDKLVKEDIRNAIQDPEVLKILREFYLRLADALEELYDLESLDDVTLIQIAGELAIKRDPERMFSMFEYLCPRVSSIRSLAEAYCRNVVTLCQRLGVK